MDELKAFIKQETAQSVAPAATTLVNSIRNRYPNPQAIRAILLYGSGLWQNDERSGSKDTIWDLYVLVDDFESSGAPVFLRAAGSLMPPNVYYIDQPARCKYALMRLDQFTRGCAGKTLIPQIWARFSQPCRVIYSRDEESLEAVNAALSNAVITFHRKNFTSLGLARTVWVEGLRSTYASELRSEDTNRPEKIFNASQDSFQERTRLAAPMVQKLGAQRRAPRLLVKVLYFIQIMKAALTFKGGVDYALWKVERHSGVKVEATDFQRNYPLIGAWPLLWEVYRKGGLR